MKKQQFLKWKEVAFCVLAMASALIIGILITQGSPGVSPDSVHYLSVAENLYQGKGFVTSIGDAPFTVAPPLYPILIFLFMQIGVTSLESARIISICSFILLMPIIFLISRMIKDTTAGYLSILLCLVLHPLLIIVSYAWTEPPFMLLSILTILGLLCYVHEGKTRYLLISGVLASLSILTRFMGVSLILSGIVVIVIKNWGAYKKTVFLILIFGLIASIPVIPWLLRNIILAGALQGAQWPSASLSAVDQSVQAMDSIIMHLLKPVPLFTRFILEPLGAPLIIGLSVAVKILIGLIVQIKYKNKHVWASYLRSRYVLMIYVIVYLVTLIAVRSIWFGGIDYRYASVVYPVGVLIIFSSAFYLFRKLVAIVHKPKLQYILIGISLIFVFFHAMQVGAFIEGVKDGQQYTSSRWDTNELLHLTANIVDKDIPIYSDMADLVAFRLKRTVSFLPNPERVQNSSCAIVYFGNSGTRPGGLSDKSIEQLNRMCTTKDVTKDGGVIWLIIK